MNDKEKVQPKCSLCDEPRSEKYRPFCSKRCADIDLNRWLTGQYAIPVEEEEPDDLEGSPQHPAGSNQGSEDYKLN